MTMALYPLLTALALSHAPLAASSAGAAPGYRTGFPSLSLSATTRKAIARTGRRAVHPPTATIEAANRAALHEPRSEGFVDSVQIYPWSDGGIYRLYTAPGHITDIALEPGEVLTAVAAGDTVRWVVGDTTSGSGASRQVHILLKPSAAGLATNLVITTDRRVYRIEAEARNQAAMTAVSWRYPGRTLVALSGNGQDDPYQTGDSGGGAPLFDFGYALEGDKPSWRPLRVFDDGRQVFIEFPPGLARDQAPPLFERSTEGASELLNYRVRGRFYVVDRLFRAAELRLGTKKPQIVRIERQEGKRR